MSWRVGCSVCGQQMICGDAVCDGLHHCPACSLRLHPSGRATPGGQAGTIRPLPPVPATLLRLIRRVKGAMWAKNW